MLPEQVTRKYQLLFILAGLVLLILAAFEPVRHNDFIDYDDSSYITENYHIKSGFTRESVVWAFTSGYSSNWHPLTWLSHMADIELFGLNPLGHHLHTLALHITAAILLFIILQNMTGALWRSAFVALVFSIHPLRVESVAWAAERKDVLGAVFWMLTLLAYLHYVKRGGIIRYLLVILSFALGLMAKPMLVTLPIILLLLDFWPLGRHRLLCGKMPNTRQTDIRYLILEKIPLIILTLVSCIITYHVQQSAGSVANMELISWMPRFSNALVGYSSYLGKLFWPSNLALLYPYPAQLPLWKPTVSLLILVAGSAFVIYRFPKQPYLAAGWFWYGISLVPVIGIVQVGAQAIADRYTYLPSIGIAIMVSWSAAELSLKWPCRRMILMVLSGIAAIAMIAGTRSQITYWKDSITLYEHTLAITQNNAIIHNFIGQNLLRQNKYDAAFEHIAKAIEIRPSYADAHMNMGMILSAQSKNDKAVAAFEQAIKLFPRCFGAFTNLATIKVQQGLLDEAIQCLRQSIQITPTPEACFNLGLILQMQGKKEEAISYHRLALTMNADDYQVLWNLACCLQETGKLQEAVKTYDKFLQVQPNFPEAISRIAWILAAAPDDQLRNPMQAIALAQKACQMTDYNDPQMLDTLAVAYAAAGQFKEAIETAQKAVDLAKTAGQIEMAQGIEKRLQLYKTGKPYYEPMPQ